MKLISQNLIYSPLDQFAIRNLLSLDRPILGDANLSLTNRGISSIFSKFAIRNLLSLFGPILGEANLSLTKLNISSKFNLESCCVLAFNCPLASSNYTVVLQSGFIVNKSLIVGLSLSFFLAVAYRIPGYHLFVLLDVKPLTYVLAGFIAVILTFVLNQMFQNKVLSYSRYVSAAAFAGICSYIVINYLSELLSLIAQTGVFYSSYFLATVGGNSSYTNENLLSKITLSWFSCTNNPDILDNQNKSLSLTNSNNNNSGLPQEAVPKSFMEKINEKLPQELKDAVMGIFRNRLVDESYVRQTRAYAIGNGIHYIRFPESTRLELSCYSPMRDRFIPFGYRLKKSMPQFLEINILKHDLQFKKAFLELYREFKLDTIHEVNEQIRVKAILDAHKPTGRDHSIPPKDPQRSFEAYHDLRKRLLLKRIDFHNKILIAAQECAARKNITLEDPAEYTLGYRPVIHDKRIYESDIAQFQGEYQIAKKGIGYIRTWVDYQG